MKAWVIDKVYDLSETNHPLKLVEYPKPIPGIGEALIKIKTCGVCHTEIDEIEGRTPPPIYPVIPGHQVIGTIEEINDNDRSFKPGDRVGIAWIFSACGHCRFCISGKENLCINFKATGRDRNGGYAEFMVVPGQFIHKIPDVFTDAEAAPLLCAGAIGHRSLTLCNVENGDKIGLSGFGASGHLVLKLIQYKYPASEVYVFARSEKEREFAVELGCKWTGDITDCPPVLLDCIIDTTPVWTPVIESLKKLKPGGRLVINAIRKENTDKAELMQLDYANHLWLEKEIKSVANVTRYDVKEFINIAANIPFKPEVEIYSFTDANKAIMDIKQRKIKGAKVLIL